MWPEVLSTATGNVYDADLRLSANVSSQHCALEHLSRLCDSLCGG